MNKKSRPTKQCSKTNKKKKKINNRQKVNELEKRRRSSRANKGEYIPKESEIKLFESLTKREQRILKQSSDDKVKKKIELYSKHFPSLIKSIWIEEHEWKDIYLQDNQLNEELIFKVHQNANKTNTRFNFVIIKKKLIILLTVASLHGSQGVTKSLDGFFMKQDGFLRIASVNSDRCFMKKNLFKILQSNKNNKPKKYARKRLIRGTLKFKSSLQNQRKKAKPNNYKSSNSNSVQPNWTNGKTNKMQPIANPKNENKQSKISCHGSNNTSITENSGNSNTWVQNTNDGIMYNEIFSVDEFFWGLLDEFPTIKNDEFNFNGNNFSLSLSYENTKEKGEKHLPQTQEKQLKKELAWERERVKYKKQVSRKEQQPCEFNSNPQKSQTPIRSPIRADFTMGHNSCSSSDLNPNISQQKNPNMDFHSSLITEPSRPVNKEKSHDSKGFFLPEQGSVQDWDYSNSLFFDEQFYLILFN
ncbi:hypothetical protein M0813_25426 [Anaeramoeba flamelloides]|uniref:Initiator binding domain-containing protein n=1 Tax=Anaeramoeba flamelloides TaxID=1746091 RepID=A0ABQ8Y3L2_9EUKA|nr:hypothetical protein M0813_25426 [Anaeramoeba flamelloides]